jgi:ATP-dependent helicase/nuclease subunit A
MRQAARRHQLEREAQFVIGIPANRMDEKVSSEELVLVQGVIDAWFEEDGQLVLVDYKTDHVPKEGGEAILLKRYRRQLDYYQYALEQITGKKVKDRLIYSFTLKTVICG